MTAIQNNFSKNMSLRLLSKTVAKKTRFLKKRDHKFSLGCRMFFFKKIKENKRIFFFLQSLGHLGYYSDMEALVRVSRIFVKRQHKAPAGLNRP